MQVHTKATGPSLKAMEVNIKAMEALLQDTIRATGQQGMGLAQEATPLMEVYPNSISRKSGIFSSPLKE